MRKMRRLLSIMICLTMVLGMMPAATWADSSAGSAQIGKYYQVNDKNGALPDTATLEEGSTVQQYDKGGPVTSDGAVRVNKTIAATDAENVFDITLTASTTEKFDQTVESPSAATVIVIDCSGSMADYGRMKSAKDAAKQFVTGFKTDIQGVDRQIAVVAFSGYDGKNVDGAYVVQNWTSANNANSINAEINKLNAYGGTNIEAGLLLADNMLSRSAVSHISNKNVILLTDGVPSYSVKDSEKDQACDFANNVVCEDGKHMDGDGSSNGGFVQHTDHKDVGTVAQSMKSKAKTYAIYVGGRYDPIDCTGSGSCSLSGTVYNWLSSTCGFTTYTTGNADELVDIFASILRIIEMKAEAWIVTDPMGDHIDFVKFNRDPQPANEFRVSDDTITWDIKSGSLAKTSTEDGKTVYTYTLSYRVKLNNLNKTYVDGKYYNTNGVTGMTYLIEENNNGEKEYFEGTAYFNIPSVRDYVGAVEFTKLGRTDNGGLANLAGAEFKLSHASDCGCGYTHSDWTVTTGSDGKVSFSNLPSGHKYVLTEESAPAGYKKADGSYKFKVSYGNIVPESNTLFQNGVAVNEQIIDIPVEKVWNDGKNQNGKRPGSIKVNLLADGKVVDSKTITAADGWKYTFKDKLKFTADGQRINYTVTEDAVDNYTSEITGSMSKYTIKNTEITDISGSKTWNDEDNQDGIRPQTITIKLLANGVVQKTVSVTEADQWSWTFEDKPVYDADGNKISYEVQENAVEGYTTTVNGYDVVNTHTPVTINVTVNKVWADNDDQDGLRPASAEIQLYSEVNGQKMAVGTPVKISAEGEGTHTFTDLPRFASGQKGVAIVYTVEEVNVPEGYTPSYSVDNATGDLVVTNTHTPATVDLSGSKTWEDNDNRDGVRPDSISIQLLANGSAVDGKVVTATADNGWTWNFAGLPQKSGGVGIAYTVSEAAVEGYYASYNGMNVTNTHSPEKTAVTVNKVWADGEDQDGIRPASVKMQLLADGQAYGAPVDMSDSHTWTELPKFREGAVGQEIVYTVSEAEVDGYTASYENNGNNITVTNTHTPATVDVSGSKTWADNDDQDGLRPESITINLLADGQVKESRTVTEADNWAWNFTDLPKFAGGEEITYTITENPVTNYTGEVRGYNVVNTHAVFKTSVSVTKAWADNNDQDGIRPGGIQVQLLANGEFSGTIVTLSEANGWTATVSGLDKYADGREIKYTFNEIEVAGYETSYSVDKEKALTTITNTHVPEVTSVSGTKSWDDADDQDGKRPESITVKLLADGEAVPGKEITVGADDQWTYSFTDLPKYADGEEIEYAVAEFEVEVADYSTTYDGMDVANAHTPEETAVTVNKVWDDADNQDGIRPNAIQLQLLANGQNYGDAVTVRNAGGDVWTHTWEDLPKYAGGQEIEYTVSEAPVDGYKAEIAKDQDTGVITVTNTHEPETITVEGAKTWVDNDNLYSTRPADIKINLMADGVLAAEKFVTEEDGWAWNFDNLPKYRNGGVEIVYSIQEETVEGYTSKVDEFNVTNTLAPGQTEVDVTKTWIDADDQDGKRPESITVNLLADGEVAETAEVTAETGWAWTFEDLPKYDAETQMLIVYTVEEIAVDGYTTSIDGFDITNTHEVELTEVAGSKTWDDNDNESGKRPESITINLLANGEVADTAVVTAADDWAWTFEDLPVYEKGKVGAAIEYTVSEEAVEGYNTAVVGYDVTNKIKTPASVGLDGVKVLKGADIAAGMFEFAVSDATGMILQTASNDDAGFFGFTEFEFDAVGTYTYYISEVIPEDAIQLEEGVFFKDGIIYDSAVYTYTVEVAENEEGNYEIADAVLTDASGEEAEMLEFVNEDISGFDESGGNDYPYYEDKDKDKAEDKGGSAKDSDKNNDKAVQTGDDFNLMFFAVMALISLGAVVVASRRRED